MRPYRWQDPAPEAVQQIKLRRITRMLNDVDYREAQMCALKAETEEHNLRVFKDAPEQPSMVLDGVEYVEAPEVSWCHECAFKVGDGDGCMDAERAAQKAFGGTCEERSVIYIRKA